MAWIRDFNDELLFGLHGVCDRYFDEALLSKFNCIPYKVHQDLLDPPGITDKLGHCCNFSLAWFKFYTLHLCLDLQVFELHLRLEDINDQIDNAHDVEWLWDKIELARFKHTKVEEIVDEWLDELKLAHHQLTIADALGYFS